MPSILGGYEYDIFISYRQKDNKHDGWITEFVNHLKGELESTFKEEISVYFDINPHDGLLDTHDVDASLKDKLKCLVFIPIISRTYCDPRSFAWEHEFKAFIELASTDDFGLKVKLSNGNVASRVLPVQIHYLDIEDVKLYESVHAGVLRGVEFIYKEAGINRSLTPDDDDKKNLNGTRYKNQMNKVALAIKEIIIGLKANSGKDSAMEIKSSETGKGERVDQKINDKSWLSRNWRQRIYSAILVTVILIFAVIFFTPGIFKRDKIKDLKNDTGKISIAVMPFDNLTGDTTLNWFGRGISSLIINGLGNSPELTVSDEYTMYEAFESMNKVLTEGISASMAREIAREVSAEAYISGSFQGKENSYWILVNLVNAKTGDIIWTNRVQIDLKSAGYLDIANKLCTEIKNCLEIKALEKNTDYDFREAYPKSSEAYRYFIEGMNAMMNKHYRSSINFFEKALEADSTFTFASFFLAWAYSTTGQDIQARRWTLNAYRYKEDIPPKYQPWLEQWYAFYVSKKLSDILKYTDILENSGIQSRWLWFDIGSTYCNFLQQYEKAVSAFEKITEISMKSSGPWKNKGFYLCYSRVLHKLGRHNEEKEVYRIYQELFPGDEEILENIATCFLSEGDTASAHAYIKKIRSEYTTGLIDEKSLEMILGSVYQDANIMEKAEEHFRKAYETVQTSNDSLQKSNMDPGYCLASLIINNKSDISEGMEIIEKKLTDNPDNRLYLGIKGWGLYKQGKKNEALKYLKMAEQKSPYFDFEVYQQIQKVEKAISRQ